MVVIYSPAEGEVEEYKLLDSAEQMQHQASLMLKGEWVAGERAFNALAVRGAWLNLMAAQKKHMARRRAEVSAKNGLKPK